MVFVFLIDTGFNVLLCLWNEQARPILMRATEGGSYEELVDPRLENDYDPQQMQCMVVCAAGCIRHSARSRPKMRQVGSLSGHIHKATLNKIVYGIGINFVSK